MKPNQYRNGYTLIQLLLAMSVAVVGSNTRHTAIASTQRRDLRARIDTLGRACALAAMRLRDTPTLIFGL